MVQHVKCPLCELHPGDEFQLADHLMTTHLGWQKEGRHMECFCGLRMSISIVVLLAHLKDKGGLEQHYRAWQLGID